MEIISILVFFYLVYYFNKKNAKNNNYIEPNNINKSAPMDFEIDLLIGGERWTGFSEYAEQERFIQDRERAIENKIYTKNKKYSNNCKCLNEDISLLENNYQFPVIFQCEKSGNLYMCSCFKDVYEIAYNDYIEAYAKHNGSYLENFVQLYQRASYKDDICHLCQKTVPPNCISQYGGKFTRMYGGYIEAEVIRQYGYADMFGYQGRLYNGCSEKHKEICKNAENKIRELAGFKKIGECHINETNLYNLIKNIYPNYNIIREYSPEWLNKQRIDIFIEELNLAIEYQGEQHFMPIEHFGGNKSLLKNKEHDLTKLKICNAHDIGILYFDYNENITIDLVKNKINKLINEGVKV